MTRLHWFTALFGLLWLLFTALLVVNLPAGRSDALYLAWLICAIGSLGSAAMDWTFLAAWGATKVAGPASDVVPIDLDDGQLAQLTRRDARTAILIPAHNEAQTLADQRALADRMINMLRVTPSWCDLHVLFDSPRRQRANEFAVCQMVREALTDSQRRRFRPWLDELRDKPSKLRSKPGSVWLWLGSEASKYEYMLVLDADSEFAGPQCTRPAARRIVERLVYTLEQDESLAMIQSAMRIRPAATWWGWTQEVSARMAEQFQGPVTRYLFGRQQTSFGHGVIFRTRDFQRLCVNTLEYDSHDFLEAADLAAAGKACIHTANAVTFENAEEPVWSFLAREFRWAKGNSQWISYLAAKRGLPWGPWAYITQGMLFYLSPLLTTLLVLFSALLVAQRRPLIGSEYPQATALLLLLVFASLTLPKLLAVPFNSAWPCSLLQVLGVLAFGLLLSPALMAIRGAGFLIGPLRLPNFQRVRVFTFGAETVLKTLAWFLHAAILGIVLAFLLTRGVHQGGIAWWMLAIHALLLAASPAIALAFSLPLPLRRAAGDGEPSELPDGSDESRIEAVK